MKILGANTRKAPGEKMLSVANNYPFYLNCEFVRQEEPREDERVVIGGDMDGWFLVLLSPDDPLWKRDGIEPKYRQGGMMFYAAHIARELNPAGSRVRFRLGAVQQFSDTRRIYPILGAKGYEDFLKAEEPPPAKDAPKKLTKKQQQNVY